MPGSPEGDQPNFSFLPAPAEKRYRRDTLTDYRPMFAYIRADKDTETFIKDLRDNKTHLLSYIAEIFEDRDNPIHDEPYGMKQLKTKYDIVRYLKTTLQVHVFDMDLYRDDYAPLGFIQLGKEQIDSYWMQWVAENWLEKHPDSDAAKAVSVLGRDAFPRHHHKLLHEMWPTFAPLLTSHLEKKSTFHRIMW
jgi:hypothetical protein